MIHGCSMVTLIGTLKCYFINWAGYGIWVILQAQFCISAVFFRNTVPFQTAPNYMNYKHTYNLPWQNNQWFWTVKESRHIKHTRTRRWWGLLKTGLHEASQTGWATWLTTARKNEQMDHWCEKYMFSHPLASFKAWTWNVSFLFAEFCFPAILQSLFFGFGLGPS